MASWNWAAVSIDGAGDAVGLAGGAGEGDAGGLAPSGVTCCAAGISDDLSDSGVAPAETIDDTKSASRIIDAIHIAISGLLK
jgi:hypothetical protein